MPVPAWGNTMNAICSDIFRKPERNLFGLSALTNIFTGTIMGLTAGDVRDPVLQHQVSSACDNLHGIALALEPQIALVTELTKGIAGIMDVVEGVYLDEAGEHEARMGEAVAGLEAFIPNLVQADRSVDRDRELDADQRRQLHAAFGEAIDVLTRAAVAARELMGAIVTHDIDAEPAPANSYRELAGMLAALKD